MIVRAHLICFLSLVNHCPLLPDVLFLLNHFSYILLFFFLSCLCWEGELWSITSSGLEHKFFSVILKPVQLEFLRWFFLLLKPTLLWLTLYKIKCNHLMSTVRQVLTKAWAQVTNTQTALSCLFAVIVSSASGTHRLYQFYHAGLFCFYFLF